MAKGRVTQSVNGQMMTMNSNEPRYWRCRGDINANHKSVIDLGPSWNTAIYYSDDKKYLKEIGFFPSQRVLKWEKSDKPILDFIEPAFSYFTCKPNVISLLGEKFKKQIKTFNIQIESENYICFRPELFLDLFDYDASEYRRLPSGDLAGIKSCVLKSPPSDGPQIFGLLGSNVLRFTTIVCDEFYQIYKINGLSGLKFREVSFSLR